MMLVRKNSISWPFVALYHQPWPPSLAIAPRLGPSPRVEEEKTPYYHPDRFYPARLGQTLHERYQLTTKLGFGSSSTVWLARDLCRWRWLRERYVAIKIVSKSHNALKNGVEHELAMLRRISQLNSQHDGKYFVRKLLDSFHIHGQDGEHVCLVFEPLREPLWLYCQRFVGGAIPPEVLKIILQMVFQGLDYLHSECQIIHTGAVNKLTSYLKTALIVGIDLKPDNIMVKIEDPTLLERDALDESYNPLPQKPADDRIIYLSRNNYGQLSAPAGVVQITDFDLSVSGNGPNSGCIQAEVYRAPEVILDAVYSYPADIWSIGVMLWDLLEGKKLFKAAYPDQAGGYDDQMHLAYITALLGPLPERFINGRRASMFYQPQRGLKNPGLIPDGFNFENLVFNISGEEKKMFIEFVKRMIKWDPEERSTAKELLTDPWLYTDFSQN